MGHKACRAKMGEARKRRDKTVQATSLRVIGSRRSKYASGLVRYSEQLYCDACKAPQSGATLDLRA